MRSARVIVLRVPAVCSGISDIAIDIVLIKVASIIFVQLAGLDGSGTPRAATASVVLAVSLFVLSRAGCPLGEHHVVFFHVSLLDLVGCDDLLGDISLVLSVLLVLPLVDRVV